MRIAESLGVQQVRVLAHLRRRMQTSACVVEIDVTVLVQSPVLEGTKRVEVQRGPVLRVARNELRVHVGQRCAVHVAMTLT